MSKWIDDVLRGRVSEVPFITQEEAALRRVRDAGAEVSPHTVRLILGPVLEALAASEAKVADAWDEGYEDGVLDGRAQGSGAPGEHETPNPHRLTAGPVRIKRETALSTGCRAQGPLVSAPCIRLAHNDGRHDDGRGTRWIEETCETCGALESKPTVGCEECIERRLENGQVSP